MKNKLIAVKDKLIALKNGAKNLFCKIIHSFKHVFTYLKNMMKCSTPFLLAIIVLLVMYNGSEDKRHELELENKASESTIISEYFVSEELKTIGKIQTAEYTYSTERSITEPREIFDLPVPFTEKSLSVMYSGKIVIGYNTADIVPAIIGKNIILKKPEPVIDNYIVKEVVKDEEGNVIKLLCSADLVTGNSKREEGPKVKGTIHWLSKEHALDREVRIYNNIFNKENVATLLEDENFEEFLNPDSLEILPHAKIEESLAQAKVGEKFQFVRMGYFTLDSKEENVFNRTVALKTGFKPAK